MCPRRAGNQQLDAALAHPVRLDWFCPRRRSGILAMQSSAHMPVLHRCPLCGSSYREVCPMDTLGAIWLLKVSSRKSNC